MHSIQNVYKISGSKNILEGPQEIRTVCGYVSALMHVHVQLQCKHTTQLKYYTTQIRNIYLTMFYIRPLLLKLVLEL